MADGEDDGVGGFAGPALEIAAAETLVFHVADESSMADRRLSSRLTTTPRFWPEMKTRRGFGRLVSAIALVGMDAFDGASCEALGAVECIGKGKARSPYEFGVKVSIVATNRRATG